MKKHKLGEILKEKQIITNDQLEHALVEQKGSNKKIGKVLIELGYINEMNVAEALTKQFSLVMVDCNDYEPSDAILALIQKETAEQKLVLPLKLEGSTLMITMANPLDWETIDDITFETGFSLNVAISSENNILDAIEKFYGSAQITQAMLNDLPEYDDVEFIKKEVDKEEQSNIKSLYDNSEAPPIVRLVTAVIADAVKTGGKRHSYGIEKESLAGTVQNRRGIKSYTRISKANSGCSHLKN